MRVESEPKSRQAVLWTVVGALAVVILAILYVLGLQYRSAYGATFADQKDVKIQTLASGQKQATIEINIQPSVNVGPHSDWLGYQSLDGKSPATVFHVPANSLVTVIVHNFDSQTPLRNPFFTWVQGTVGGVEYVDGKAIKVMSPDLTSHTFTIPDLGVSVPMEGVPSSGKPDHYTMKFSFRTHGKGLYRWQCIVPCGSGLYGFGGPMQEMGYMDGIIYVG